MTSIAPHPARPGLEPARPPETRQLAARWTLRGVAIDERGIARATDNLAERAVLVITVSARGDVESWVEDDKGRRTAPERAAACATIVEDEDAGLVHADAPGVVHATWRTDGRPVFGRTALLERMGLAGGRGEFVKRRVADEGDARARG